MGERIRVLHVDDEVDFLEVVRDSLERVDPDLDIDIVTSVDEAWSRLEAGGYDCIVSDYDIPGTHGIRFLKDVREAHGDLPFILFTGKGGEAVASEAMAEGVTDYLQKRVSQDQFSLLSNRIRNAAGRYHAKQQLDEHVRRLETLVANLPGIAYRCQGSYPWRMESIMGELEELTGYTAEDFTEGDRTWGEDVVHPDDREKVTNALTSGVGTTGSFEVRYRILTATGETKWVWESGQEVDEPGEDVPMLEGFITDITGWYHHRERQRVLFEDAADAIVEVVFEDGTAIIERVNPAFEAVFGVSEFEATERPVNDVIVPESDRSHADDIDRRVQSGEIVEEELMRRTADGDRWFLLRTVPFTLGTEQRAYATYVDITPQKTREAAIEALHDATRSMFENPDEDAIHRAAVEAASEVLGLSSSGVYRYDRSEDVLVPVATTAAVGTPLEDLDPIDRGGPVWRVFETQTAAVVADDADLPDRLVHDGDPVRTGLVAPIGTRGVLVSTSVVPTEFDEADLRLTGLLASATASALDTAEREEQLTKLHQSAMAIGAATDPADVYDRLITAAEEILEFDFAVADTVEDDELVTAATSSAIEAGAVFDRTPIDADDNVAARAFRTGDPDLTGDLRELDVTPADPDFLSALTVPINGFGVFQAAAKRMDAFDETDLEFAELLVTHAREALTRLDRTQELEARTNELDRQNERLEAFASIVSHDLRNPLNVIAGRLELARDDPTDEHLAAIQDAVDRMESIIEHTLALAREGRTVGETEPIHLDEIATACWTRVATGDATLEVVDDLTFLGDPERTEHVLENLFRNAIEHSDGAVTVEVGCIGGSGFYVADDGPGIPEADRESVFEPGYTTGEAGAGIGLSIVTEIVDAHGWEISVTAAEGGGARFEITGLAVGG